MKSLGEFGEIRRYGDRVGEQFERLALPDGTEAQRKLGGIRRDEGPGIVAVRNEEPEIQQLPECVVAFRICAVWYSAAVVDRLQVERTGVRGKNS
ncbi:hypothetical protein GCM10009639_33490 [Kitasatospora putterlickiae]|uniref:Uncharacterized protein n=1 Tax=Kitasatospora putterlickiae TaxID=221725 RepID=A0ABN1Y3D1_9ACTN